MILQQLAPEHVETAWPLLKTYTDQLSDRFPDDYPRDRILPLMLEGKIVPWVIWDEERKENYGLGLTEIAVKASGRKALNVFAVGRDHRLWVHLLKHLEEHGRQNGCSKVEIVGRVGWERSLGDYKREKLALFSKDLA